MGADASARGGRIYGAVVVTLPFFIPGVHSIVFGTVTAVGDGSPEPSGKTTVIPKHQNPVGEPHFEANEREFIVPVTAAPSAFVDTTEYVVQLEAPLDSADPEEADVPAEGDEETTESPQTLRKAA